MTTTFEFIAVEKGLRQIANKHLANKRSINKLTVVQPKHGFDWLTVCLRLFDWITL